MRGHREEVHGNAVQPIPDEAHLAARVPVAGPQEKDRRAGRQILQETTATGAAPAPQVMMRRRWLGVFFGGEEAADNMA